MCNFKILILLCISIPINLGIPMPPRNSPSTSMELEPFVDHHGHHSHRTHSKHNHHKTVVNSDEEKMQSDHAKTLTPFQTKFEQAIDTTELRDKQAARDLYAAKALQFMNGSGSNGGVRDVSFYANCEQPKDSSAEENDDFMRLSFTYSPMNGNLAEASLRLYRKTNFSDGGKTFSVTAFYHVKGSKKHKLKDKADCVELTSGMTFAKLNVTQGIRDLKGKHFNVVVQIKDEYGKVIKATDFFKGPNCTAGTTTPKPLPTEFEESHPNFKKLIESTNEYPKLDIKTIQGFWSPHRVRHSPDRPNIGGSILISTGNISNALLNKLQSSSSDQWRQIISQQTSSGHS